MIAKVTVISHGANTARYATEKDKAKIIKLNLLPDDIPLEGIWLLMVIHQKKFEAKLSRYQPLENTTIRIEVSTARNESEGWTHADWERLANDFVQELDIVNISSRAGRANAARTNLGGSQSAPQHPLGNRPPAHCRQPCRYRWQGEQYPPTGGLWR